MSCSIHQLSKSHAVQPNGINGQRGPQLMVKTVNEQAKESSTEGQAWHSPIAGVWPSPQAPSTLMAASNPCTGTGWHLTSGRGCPGTAAARCPIAAAIVCRLEVHKGQVQQTVPVLVNDVLKHKVWWTVLCCGLYPAWGPAALQ